MTLVKSGKDRFSTIAIEKKWTIPSDLMKSFSIRVSSSLLSRGIRRNGSSFLLAVKVTGGSDISIECLDWVKILPFPQRIDPPRILKAPLRNTCITWALEGGPENVNKILNMVTLTETAISSGHF